MRGVRVARVATVAYSIHQVEQQVVALKEAGADVSIVCSDLDNASLACAEGCLKFPLEIPRRITPLRDLLALWRLYRLFLRERFQVVHSTTPKAGLLCALAGWLARVPVRLHTFTGQPWVTMNGFKRSLLRACDRLTGRLNTHCYTDSHGQRAFLIEEGIVAPERLSVIGAGSLCGVALGAFDPAAFDAGERAAIRAELGIGPDAAVILFVGRVTPDKGIAELLEAFSRLRRERNLHLIVVGPVEEDAGAFRDEAGAQVHFTGYCDSPARYMAVSDLLCLPSYREGFGTVVIEAAGMGLPAVGTAIYGLSDAIVDGRTGLLVPVRDVESLARALARLLDDADLRECLGRQAQQRAVEEFDSRMLGARIIEEYRRFLV